MERLMELCKKWKFYYFSTLKDFDKWIDFNWINQKKNGVAFKNWVEVMIQELPTKYYAYWIKK